MKEIKKKRGRRAAFFLAAIMAGCFSLTGWADDLNGIRDKAETINSIEANFIQEKHLEILKEPLISKGKFYFSAPRSLRWEYQEPVRSILLMKDESIRRYAETGSDMVEERSQGLEAIRVFLQDISRWMTGEFEGNPDIKAEVKSDNIILLRPKSEEMAGIIQKIELKLTETSGIVDTVKIYEDRDSYTVIRFIDTKINQSIDEALFEQIDPNE
ncbi:MAG: LolA family protein [Desulfosudaceae bacterium]